MPDRKKLAGIAIGTLLLALLLLPIPGLNRPLWRELEDAAHGAVFALLTPLLALWMGQRRSDWAYPRLALVAGAIATAAGLSTEWLQSFTGRDPSWHDALNNLLGAAAGLLALGAWRQRAHWLRTLSASGLALASFVASNVPLWQQLATQLEAHRALPILLGPSTTRASLNAVPQGASIELRNTIWQIDFRREFWSGIIFEGWTGDWRGYRALVLDLENPNNHDLTLGLVVRDNGDTTEYRNRFNTEISLPAGTRRSVRFAVETIAVTPSGRHMDLSAIRRVVVFRLAGAAPNLRIHIIRLE